MISLTINGRTHDVDADPTTPLLYVLRDHLALNGAKFGCGLGQCGACTVIVDGQAAFSCITPISVLTGRQVRPSWPSIGNVSRSSICATP